MIDLQSPAFEKLNLPGQAVNAATVRCGQASTIHRFFDTSPISPSGNLIGLFEFPFQDRQPRPGEYGHVSVRDLSTGEEVYRTATSAWDTQLGAQVQWGGSDDELFFNRMDESTWRPYGVRVDCSRCGGDEERLPLAVYMVSNNGRYIVSPSLIRIGLLQGGYGVFVPSGQTKALRGASAEDGLWLHDRYENSAYLALSFEAMYEGLRSQLPNCDPTLGSFYGFHTKINPQSDRLMFVVRWLESTSQNITSFLVTCRLDGSEVRMAVDPATWRGGHHPNWCPDGETIVMNLKRTQHQGRLNRLTKKFERLSWKFSRKFNCDVRYYAPSHTITFKRFRFDGTQLSVLCPNHGGSGHPSLSQCGNYLLTDAYLREPYASLAGDVPIRLLNLQLDTCTDLLRVPSRPLVLGPKNVLRVDPHPVWDRSGRYITLNAVLDGRRRVVIADVSASTPSRATTKRSHTETTYEGRT